MPALLPPDTNWLDLITLVIALAALYLTVRRDRLHGEVRIRVSPFLDSPPVRFVEGQADLGIRLSNAARRDVTAEYAGLSVTKARTKPFEGFHGLGYRISATGNPASDPLLPKMLRPGAPAHVIKVPLYMVKSAFRDEPPVWAWCEDTDGTLYWGRISEEIRTAIRQAKGRIAISDGQGGVLELEVEDDGSRLP